MLLPDSRTQGRPPGLLRGLTVRYYAIVDDSPAADLNQAKAWWQAQAALEEAEAEVDVVYLGDDNGRVVSTDELGSYGALVVHVFTPRRKPNSARDDRLDVINYRLNEAVRRIQAYREARRDNLPDYCRPGSNLPTYRANQVHVIGNRAVLLDWELRERLRGTGTIYHFDDHGQPVDLLEVYRTRRLPSDGPAGAQSQRLLDEAWRELRKWKLDDAARAQVADQVIQKRLVAYQDPRSGRKMHRPVSGVELNALEIVVQGYPLSEDDPDHDEHQATLARAARVTCGWINRALEDRGLPPIDRGRGPGLVERFYRLHRALELVLARRR